jgi:hypothetical protein
MAGKTHLFTATRWLLKAAIGLNIFFIAALLIAIGAMLAVPNQLDLPAELATLAHVGTLVLTVSGVLVCAVLALFVLRTIAAIIESAISGDPFVGENAARLVRIGWLLLAINVVEILTKLMVYEVVPQTVRANMDPVDISPISLLAVLLVFVLAQIFRHGSKMRADLEGTV